MEISLVVMCYINIHVWVTIATDYFRQNITSLSICTFLVTVEAALFFCYGVDVVVELKARSRDNSDDSCNILW